MLEENQIPVEALGVNTEVLQELEQLTPEQLEAELAKYKGLILNLEEIAVWSGLFSTAGIGFTTLSFLVSVIKNSGNLDAYFSNIGSLKEAPFLVIFAIIGILSAHAVQLINKLKEPESR